MILEFSETVVMMAYGRPARTRPRPRRSSTALRSRPTGSAQGRKRAVTRYRAKTFKKAVTSVLNSQSETKFKSKSYDLSFIYGAGLNYAAMDPNHQRGLCYNNVMSDLNIEKGTQGNQRVGSQITPVYMKVDGYVVTNDYITDSGSGTGAFNECTLPYDVKIMAFKFKPGQALPLSPAHALDMVLVNDATGVQTDVAFDGTIDREMLPLAHQIQMLATRKLRMRPPLSGTTDATINGQTSNAPYYRYFSMKIPLPKKLTYEPGVNRPVNCWFSLAAYIIDGRGQAIHQQQVRCKMYARATLAYKDL